MSVVKLPSGKWRLQIRRKRLSVDELYPTEEAARAAEAGHLEKQQSNGMGKTLSQLWTQYSDSRYFTDKAPKTQKTEAGRVQAILQKLGHYKLAELEADTNIIEDFIDTRSKHISPRTKKNLSKTSIRLEIATLSALVKFAKKRKYVSTNFMILVERPSQTKRKRRVSLEEQGKLSIHARSSDPDVAQAARFQLALRHIGCRPGELATILVKNVSLNRKEITFLNTKNGEDRCVHLTPDSLTMINLQLASLEESSPYLFSTWSRYKKEWVPYNYATGVKKLKVLEIVKADYHPHACRREFVSRAFEGGLTMPQVMKQTGHQSSQALEIYDQSKATSPDMRASLNKLDDEVKLEIMLASMEALGATPQQMEDILKRMGKDGTVSPFSGVSYKQNQ